jgi:hypothetical protein
MCFPVYHSKEGFSIYSCLSTAHLQAHHSSVVDGANSSSSIDRSYTLEVIETYCAVGSPLFSIKARSNLYWLSLEDPCTVSPQPLFFHVDGCFLLNPSGSQFVMISIYPQAPCTFSGETFYHYST